MYEAGCPLLHVWSAEGEAVTMQYPRLQRQYSFCWGVQLEFVAQLMQLLQESTKPWKSVGLVASEGIQILEAPVGLLG